MRGEVPADSRVPGRAVVTAALVAAAASARAALEAATCSRNSQMRARACGQRAALCRRARGSRVREIRPHGDELERAAASTRRAPVAHAEARPRAAPTVPPMPPLVPPSCHRAQLRARRAAGARALAPARTRVGRSKRRATRGARLHARDTARFAWVLHTTLRAARAAAPAPHVRAHPAISRARTRVQPRTRTSLSTRTRARALHRSATPCTTLPRRKESSALHWVLTFADAHTVAPRAPIATPKPVESPRSDQSQTPIRPCTCYTPAPCASRRHRGPKPHVRRARHTRNSTTRGARPTSIGPLLPRENLEDITRARRFVRLHVLAHRPRSPSHGRETARSARAAENHATAPACDDSHGGGARASTSAINTRPPLQSIKHPRARAARHHTVFRLSSRITKRPTQPLSTRPTGPTQKIPCPILFSRS